MPITITTPGVFVAGYDDLILASGPTVFYKLDETGSPALVMFDSSGNGNDGTHTHNMTRGVPGLVTDGGTSITYHDAGGSNPSKSILFSGVLSLPTNTTPKTIEFWMSTTDTIGPLIVGRNAGVSGNPINGIYLGNAGIGTIVGTIKAIVRSDSGGGLKEITSPLTYNDGNTHHVVTTMDTSKNWIVYVDGQPIITTTHALNTSTTCGTCQIALDATTNGGIHGGFGGEIDNVAVYDSTLDAATVEAHFDAGVA